MNGVRVRVQLTAKASEPCHGYIVAGLDSVSMA